MKLNINMIEGKPVTFKYSKTGQLKEIAFDDIIIYVIKMSPEQVQKWTGDDELNGEYWLDIFVDHKSDVSPSSRTEDWDSFHGNNYDINEAIHGLI